MSYDELKDEDLARLVSADGEFSYERALRAIQSEDPDLGRTWAISLLEARSRHRQAQKKITRHREDLRRSSMA